MAKETRRLPKESWPGSGRVFRTAFKTRDCTKSGHKYYGDTVMPSDLKVDSLDDTSDFEEAVKKAARKSKRVMDL